MHLKRALKYGKEDKPPEFLWTAFCSPFLFKNTIIEKSAPKFF